MVTDRSWTAYPATYRAREMKILAGWISSGHSGSVVGLPGCGRSNLLGFLCYRPEVLQSYLSSQANSAALIPVDLNNLPADDLSTLYRVMLRSFYRVGEQFEQTLRKQIIDLYQATQAVRDPFVSQSALQEVFLMFQARKMRIVFVLNYFDSFCEVATPRMVNTLRSLRDNFKNTLSYIAGMYQEVAYLPDPTILGQMYDLLDNHVFWVGAMTDQDAQNLIDRATYTAAAPPNDTDIAALFALTGKFPVLLRATCDWWLNLESRAKHTEWITTLLAERSIQHRLTRIWTSLTQEEQFVLSELQKLQTLEWAIKKDETAESTPERLDKTFQGFSKQHRGILTGLAEKGVCYQTDKGWRIGADLLVAYVAEVEGRGRGRIWLDEKTGEIYQGQSMLKDLTALERSVLTFLIKHPHIRHTKTDLIDYTWPDDLRREGVTDNSLYQVILALRKAVEPNLSKPVYLITWRGKPEGGYQFFPEGRPG